MALCSLAGAQALSLEMFPLDWDVLAQGQQEGAQHPSLAGELHPCTPSLWGDVFSVTPIEQPHCRECRERGRWKRTVKWEETTEGSCGDTHSPSPAVPRLVVFKMVLMDIFMASLSSPILVSYKEILNNFLGNKNDPWVIYLYEMMNMSRRNGRNVQNAYQPQK